MREIMLGIWQGAWLLLAAMLNPAAAAALPSRPKGSLLLQTNAIAFRSNVSETAIVGAEVYMHRRDSNKFRLAQFILSDSGKPYALMAFPSSFGLSTMVGDDMVDLSFDFNLDQNKARSVTYYSSSFKQTILLPALPLALSNYPTSPKMDLELDRRDRAGRSNTGKTQQQQQLQQLTNYIASPDQKQSAGARISTTHTPTISISVTVQDACGMPIPSLDALQLSCTPVRFAQAQSADENTSPYRGDPKWLWRATTTHEMQQTSPGVFTGTCDTTNLVAASTVHHACGARMRSAGDGFGAFCAPLGPVIDALRDVRYKTAHVYGGDYVTVSRFLAATQPAFTAYERACAFFRRSDVQPRVDVLLAAEECGFPPEVAIEVRGKGVSQMLGSMSATQEGLEARITALSGLHTRKCPPTKRVAMGRKRG